MAKQLVVLGGGPGGYAAAFLAADLGMKVTIVEADPRLGGTCLLRGCIPSKALLHVAKVISEAKELAGWGVQFASPKLEVAALRARKEKVIDTLTGGLKQLAKRRNVEVIQARGVFENSTTLRLERSEKGAKSELLEFEHCILATGSRPMKIPAFDLPTPRVMDSTGALDLPDIPESLLVVGGGYIGLEMGTVYAELGTKVSVVELTDGLLPGADRDLVKPLHSRLEKLFAAIHLKTKVVSLADKKDSIEVSLQAADGSGARTERFSRVLVSVGRRPNSDGLGLGKHASRNRSPRFCRRRPSSPHGRSAHSGDRRRGGRTDAARTRRRIRGKWPSRRCTAVRPFSSRRPFRRSCSPIRKSPGPA